MADEDNLSNVLKLWAKSDRAVPDNYHPLLYHCIDVAFVARVLKSILINDLSPIRANVLSASALAGIASTSRCYAGVRNAIRKEDKY